MKTLVINTYAGSLLLGAKRAKVKVIGSYEDAGYGMDIQRANFRGIDFRETTDQWPRQDLRGVTVIAHPPCAAFSVQTPCNDACNRGIDAEKFQQTRAVIDYALSSRCDALAVESVIGAYRGAWDVHAEMARTHGYNVYRVLQNAATFGVPQWRARFWVIFVRRRLLSDNALRLGHAPKLVTVGDVLEDTPSSIDPRLEMKLKEQSVLLRSGGLSFKEARRVLDGSDPGLVPAVIGRVLKAKGIKPPPLCDIITQYWRKGNLLSSCARVLPENEFAGVILSNSWFVARGRNLSYVEYKRIMGYPDDYVFPRLNRLREFLSRGVVPSVATWVLNQLKRNLAGKPLRGAVPVRPGETYDVRPKRAAWARGEAAVPQVY